MIIMMIMHFENGGAKEKNYIDPHDADNDKKNYDC